MTKLGNDGVDINFAKQQFQKVFKKDNYAIYDELVQEIKDSFKRFNINSKTDFAKRVNNLDDEFYKFIKAN